MINYLNCSQWNSNSIISLLFKNYTYQANLYPHLLNFICCLYDYNQTAKCDCLKLQYKEEQLNITFML